VIVGTRASQPSIERPGSPGVSVVIIAQDEEPNIGACLESVRWADEVVVVDGGSRDRTPEIAAALGARVHHNPWPGFWQQRELSLRLATQEWVFALDADERVPPELAQEVEEVVRGGGGGKHGFYVYRDNYFLGRHMTHGGWGQRPVLRLFRRQRARTDGRIVHEGFVVDGRIGVLRHHLVHDSHPNLHEYIENMNRCTSLEAEEALALGVRRSWLPPLGALWKATRRWLASDRSSRTAYAILKDELKNRHEWVPLQPFAPLLRFLQMYVLQRGFLDGRHGLYLSLLSAIYVFVKRVKLWELRHSAQASPDLEERVLPRMEEVRTND
jgi:glycosyltransferase involved in cell wall biosynthesis